MNVKDAVIFFQYAERIKSDLIIASKLYDEIAFMDEGECEGAKKLLVCFINAELNLGESVSHALSSITTVAEEAISLGKRGVL